MILFMANLNLVFFLIARILASPGGSARLRYTHCKPAYLTLELTVNETLVP